MLEQFPLPRLDLLIAVKAGGYLLVDVCISTHTYINTHVHVYIYDYN